MNVFDYSVFVRRIRAFSCFASWASLSLIRHRVAEDGFVHAFVTSRVDCCNSVFASSPKTITDELQRVLIYYWMPQHVWSLDSAWHRQVRSRSVTAASRWTALASVAWHSSAGAVQACLDCSPMSPESSTDVPCRSLHSHLWSRWSPAPTSARRQQLNVPHVRRVIDRRAFASAGPTVWNSLPDNLRDSTVGPDQFQRELKTHLFACLFNMSSTVR